MASTIEKLIYSNEGYLDQKMGPYSTLTDLKNIKYRFVGMTVNVLTPVQMEVWLVNGKLNSNWRIKQFSSIPTHAKLIEFTNTIFSSFKKMITVGTEATVIADETNDGKVTKYWVISNDGNAIVWEKMNNGNLEENYVPKNCITGEDIEI